MDASYSLLLKCPPLNKPPSFNGNHYTYWKQKMKDFIEDLYIDIWDVVDNGYELLKILIDGIFQPKVKSFWIEKERKKHLLASKVKWIITNSLTFNEYERILNYTTIKEVWDTLEVAHTGITQVKTSKIHVLVSSYEMFKTKEGESIKDFV